MNWADLAVCDFDKDGKPTILRLLKQEAYARREREGCDLESTVEWQALRELEAWRSVHPQYEFRDGGIHRRPETLPPAGSA